MSSREERLNQARERAKTGIREPAFNFNAIEKFSGIKEIKLDKLVPAPAEWNFYSPLSDDKMYELIDSIIHNGLLVPIIVWEQINGTYMILAGHNRVQAYNRIKDQLTHIDFNTIPAFIKGVDEIDEFEAREIIIDTNWVSRNLTPLDISKSIIEKYTVLKSRAKYGKYGDGRIRDIIAKQYDISGRMIDNYRKLNNLVSELQLMLNDGTISIKSAICLSRLDNEMQKYLYNNYKNNLDFKYTSKIKNDMAISELDEIFNDTSIKHKKLSLNVSNLLMDKYKNIPKDMMDRFNKDFSNFFDGWYKNNIE